MARALGGILVTKPEAAGGRGTTPPSVVRLARLMEQAGASICCTAMFKSRRSKPNTQPGALRDV